jgi:hypothetical protein
MYKKHALPEPRLQLLGREHLLALIDRAVFSTFDTLDIAHAVYDVETRYVHNWMADLIKQSDQLKDIKDLDLFIQHCRAWDRMSAQDALVHQYWEKWIMNKTIFK